MPSPSSRALLALALLLLPAAVHCAQPAQPPTSPALAAPAISSPPPKAAAAAVGSNPAPITDATPVPTDRCSPLVLETPEIPPEHLDTAVPTLIDPSGEAMKRFYERLARVIRGTARDHVRLGFYGDSNMTLDLISGTMRRMLQRKYGDAGHGFVAFGRPWRHYFHMDVVHGLDQTAWEEYAISTRKVADGLYGFSGIAAQSSQVGAKAWLRTANDPAPIGRSASHLELHYLRRPGAGVFSVMLDGSKLADVNTDAADLSSAVMRWDFSDGAHSIEFVAHGRRPVRLFGAALERGKPSVIVDALGIGGVSAHSLAHGDRLTTSQSLANRRYDLVIYMLGTNTVHPASQPEAMRQIIAMHREGIADVSLLVMSPPDHSVSFKEGRSDKNTVKVARQMREIAEQNRCAFWDFWEAMGGESSMLRFQKKKWNMWDLYHLNEKGASYMASRIVHAIWRDFGAWLHKHPDAGCTPE
ncbi:MAG: hypothetical protein HY898_18100 [Deltaproteobacteria bacterium]|nr:hypothetical protein [Deltaproteobacteria bacterium]